MHYSIYLPHRNDIIMYLYNQLNANNIVSFAIFHSLRDRVAGASIRILSERDCGVAERETEKEERKKW